jgi:uncharacterized protein YcnI
MHYADGTEPADRAHEESHPVIARLSRALLVLLATAAAVLALGIGTASAHVSVSSTDAAPGGFGELTFRVPTESDTAATISLRVQLPTDTPIANVSIKPVPGWTAARTTTPLDPPVTDEDGNEVTEAISEITWTAAAGAGIKPGEYQTFSISAGPLPDTDTLVLPAIQGYDDGTEVAWIEPTVDGQEPEHPAPTLSMASSSDAGAGSAETASAGSQSTDSADSGPSGVAVTALVLSIIGVLAALVALALALTARRRNTTA